MPSIASILWTLIALMPIPLWAYLCVRRTSKDLELLYKKCTAVNSDYMTKVYNAYRDEGDRVNPVDHAWYRFTFRNPWRLYGPVCISLVMDFPIDDEFLQWHEHVYCSPKFDHAGHWRIYVRTHMLRWHSNPTINPMMTIMYTGLGLRLEAFCPKIYSDATIAGAEEYDEIMKMQEQLGI